MTVPGSIRRVFLLLSALGLAWSCAVAVSGGFLWESGWIRISSRNPRGPFLLSLMGLAAFFALAPAGDRRRQWESDWAWTHERVSGLCPAWLRPHIHPGALAAMLAAFMCGLGLVTGAHVAGGADSYGYVSEARMMQSGRVFVDQPLLNELPAYVPKDVLIPLGYRLSPDAGRLVPAYSPGLPLVMALFERIGGSRAVYVVMPLCGGLLIWVTYALGRPLIGDGGALLAAGLLAINPAFIIQLVHTPMSDIVAAAWWASALLLALRPGGWYALGAGITAAFGIMTRPNLLPLAAIIACASFAGGAPPRSTMSARRLAFRFLLFGMPIVAGCLVVAYLNDTWYGSPVSSGYGQLAGELFRWEHFVPNLRHFGRWIYLTAGPVSVLSALGLYSLLKVPPGGERRRVAVYAAFALTGYACYAFYYPYDTWWYLRFLFPILPVFFVFMIAGMLYVDGWLPAFLARTGVVILMVVTVASILGYSRSVGVLNAGIEQRYETAGIYVRDNLPPNAAVLSSLHSGSIRHYSHRLSVRFDFIPPEGVHAFLRFLQSRGYQPYVLVDDSERDLFRDRFAGTGFVEQLSELRAGVARVNIYRVGR